MIGIESIALSHPSPCEWFGEFDDGARAAGPAQGAGKRGSDDAARLARDPKQLL